MSRIAHIAAGASFAEIDKRATQAVFEMGHAAALKFLIAHETELKAAGVYEIFLIDTFLSCPWNWQDVPLPVLRKAFLAADRQRLRSWSAPLPGKGPYVLYRGIAGEGEARRPRGLSWTADRDRAVWFAERLGLQDPAVVRGVFPARAIFMRSNRRGEDEYIADAAMVPLTTVWRGEPLPGVRDLAAALMTRQEGLRGAGRI